MSTPYGLALFSDGSLAVSDPALNRILLFKKPKGGDFQSSALATTVLGQQTFNNASTSTSAQGLNQPLKLGVDTSDRLYVADSGNNRMVVYNNTLTATNGAGSAFQLNNLYLPEGIAINEYTGEIWVALGDDLLWRLPELDTLELQSNPNAPPYTQQLSLQTTPFAVTLDDNFNPIVVDASNRATFFFPKLTYQNSASYNGGDTNGNYFQGLAPGQLATLYQVGLAWNFTATGSATTNPWPTTLAGLQVSVNGVLSPIYYVGASAIGFQVPSATPPSGTVPFLVTQVSTGAILAAGSIPMAQYNPGFFASNELGTGQIAARNPDNSINSPSNPISRDGTQVITFYLTGGGLFSGGPNPPPQDGYAPTATASTADVPNMLNASFGANALAPASDLQYSGAGGFAGGYQINWLVDSKIPPSSSTGGMTIVTVTLGGVASNVGPNNSKVQLWFYTK
jgi:uncharacterized protein (TIGR03437 family)